MLLSLSARDCSVGRGAVVDGDGVGQIVGERLPTDRRAVQAEERPEEVERVGI
jgi:hypothetical protein